MLDALHNDRDSISSAKVKSNHNNELLQTTQGIQIFFARKAISITRVPLIRTMLIAMKAKPTSDNISDKCTG